MPQTQPRQSTLYEPTGDQVRSYADAFRRLGDRIRDSKLRTEQLDSLRSEMCEVYPAEAGRLFCVCLRANALIGFVGYVRGTPSLQDTAREEWSRAYQRHRISELFHLWERTDDALEEDLPTKRKEANAVCAILWYVVIRSRLVKEARARFRPDLHELYHSWVDGIAADRLEGAAGPERSFSTQAADFLGEFTYYPAGKSGEEMFPVLRAHADVRAEACRLLADLLEREADWIDEDRTQVNLLEGRKRVESADELLGGLRHVSRALAGVASEAERKARAQPYAERVRAEVARLAGNNLGLPKVPGQASDPEDDIRAMFDWLRHAKEISLGSGDRDSEVAPPKTPTQSAAPSEGEWSAPMAKAEMARRITGKANARSREVEALLRRFGLERVAGLKWRVRLDTMDPATRRKIEMLS
jgi:hypothetical protein